MRDGSCTPEAGLIFIDLVDNVEKTGDHLTNIAQAVIGGLQWDGIEKMSRPSSTATILSLANKRHAGRGLPRQPSRRGRLIRPAGQASDGEVSPRNKKILKRRLRPAFRPDRMSRDSHTKAVRSGSMLCAH